MIKIKSPEEIAQMQKLGKIASSVLKNLVRTTSAGISTKDIEENARLLIDKFKVRSAFLGYKGFPGLLCISLNEELIHGIPSPSRIVKKGDLVIAISGSGKTSSTLAVVKTARKLKITIATITSFPRSPIAKISDAVVVIKGRRRGFHSTDIRGCVCYIYECDKYP